MTDQSIREQTAAAGRGSRRSWFYAVGFVGLAIAVASIADMFSARPYDGIVPVPYSRDGHRRARDGPGRPGRSGRDPGRRLRRRASGDAWSTRSPTRRPSCAGTGSARPSRISSARGSCPAAPGRGPRGELRTVACQLSSERLGGTTYLYAVGPRFSLLLHRALRLSQRVPTIAPRGSSSCSASSSCSSSSAACGRRPTGGSTSSCRTPARSASSCCRPSSSTSS